MFQHNGGKTLDDITKFTVNFVFISYLNVQRKVPPQWMWNSRQSYFFLPNCLSLICDGILLTFYLKSTLFEEMFQYECFLLPYSSGQIAPRGVPAILLQTGRAMIFIQWGSASARGPDRRAVAADHPVRSKGGIPVDAAGCEAEAEDDGRIRDQRRPAAALASGPSELVVSGNTFI